MSKTDDTLCYSHMEYSKQNVENLFVYILLCIKCYIHYIFSSEFFCNSFFKGEKFEFNMWYGRMKNMSTTTAICIYIFRYVLYVLCRIAIFLVDNSNENVFVSFGACNLYILFWLEKTKIEEIFSINGFLHK